AVPLAQLVPLASDELTQQAIADWQYWHDRGYHF
ncbi:calcium-binding protein, partial [Cupriavidus taiwanensis]